ncbi:hypothetical protein Acr_16g0007920 [Actinidia rufa]|uniref:CCHC-type domain-containing protein n=1 Tax=Actinidia rufa TaxID=165716 RepID=A0A7J0G118_9ERIC|nr:hypothetical protein Acr_16g0007920 [Actinidia rufa]
MGSTDQSESQALVSEGSRERGRGQGRGHHRGTGKERWRSQARGRTVRCFYCDQEGHIKRDCPKYKAQDQSSDTAATAVMAVDENEFDVLLAASDDGKFDASGGILRVSKGNKEMLWGKKTRGLYRLEGNVQTGGATVRHGSSGISEKSGQRKQPLHRGTQSKRRGTWRIRSGTRAQGDALGYVRKSGQTRVMQPVQDVHREAQRKETKSILRSFVRTREERWSHDNSQSDELCGAPRWGVWCTPVGGARHLSEKVQALRCGGAYTSVGSGVAR